MDEISIDDFLDMAGNNVYDTEYSHKLNISCKHTTYRMFKELKYKLNKMDIKVNNAQLFEYMVVEMYNSNLNSL